MKITDLDEAQLSQAQEAFSLAAWQRGRGEDASDEEISREPPMLLSTLVRLLNERPGGGLPGAVAEAMLRQPSLRPAVRRLLRDRARFRGPMVAAASSGAVRARGGEGFSLTLVESQVEPDQVYVVIEMQDGQETPPAVLVVVRPDGRAATVELPDFVGTRCRLIEYRDSELVAALGDKNAELYLH